VRSVTRPARKKLVSPHMTIAPIPAARNISRGVAETGSEVPPRTSAAWAEPANPARTIPATASCISGLDGFGAGAIDNRGADEIGDVHHQRRGGRSIAQFPDYPIDKKVVDVNGGGENASGRQ